MKKGLLFILILYSGLHLGYSILCYNPITHPTVSGDFRITFEGTRHWRETGSYRETGLTSGGVYYPPLFYVLLLPLTVFDFRSVAYFLYLLQFLLFPMAIGWMVRSAWKGTPVPPTAYLIATVLTVNFQPFLETMAQHKVEGIELFLICLALFLFLKGRDFWVGMILSLATALKYLPGILFFYFLLRREVGVLRGFFVGAMALGGVLLAVLGPQTAWDYLVVHPVELSMGSHLASNKVEGHMERANLSGMVYRWFAQPTPPNNFEYALSIGFFGVSQPALARVLVNLLKGLSVGLYLAFILRRKRAGVSHRREASDLFLLEVSLTLLMIFVIAEGIKTHYGILLLPAFVYVGLILAENRPLFRWAEKALFLAAYGLAAMLVPGGLLNRLPPHPLWGQQHANMYLFLSLPFCGYLLLGGCIFLCARRLTRVPPRQALPGG